MLNSTNYPKQQYQMTKNLTMQCIQLRCMKSSDVRIQTLENASKIEARKRKWHEHLRKKDPSWNNRDFADGWGHKMKFKKQHK
jgi:hypothetical protein